MDNRKFCLILGRKCNGNCVYCHLGLNEDLNYDTSTDPMPSPKDVAKYFPEDGNYKMTLYGGEPLVYWDFVAQFLYEIKQRNPESNTIIISNGILLNKEMVKVINETNTLFTLSHDGPYYEQTRLREDPLKKNPELFLSINRFEVNAVCSSISPDFYAFWEYFDSFSKIHDIPPLPVQIRFVKDAGSGRADYLFNRDRVFFEKMLDKVFDNMYKSARTGNFDSREWKHFEPMLNNLNYRIRSNNRNVMCGADTISYDIDVYGNLYSCHNSSEPFSHISLGLKAVENPIIVDPSCLSCSAYFYCGGGCILCSKERKVDTMCYTVKEVTKRLVNIYKKLGGDINV